MPEWKEEIRKRLATVNLEPTREAEIVEELTQHIEALYQALRADGETKDEASRAVFAELSDKNWSSRELRRLERAITREPVVFGARRKNLMAELRSIRIV